MTQHERLDYLVHELCNESGSLELGYHESESNFEDKERLLRSLMNIRMPKPISPQFIEIYDQYLQSKAKEKGIVTLEDIPDIHTSHKSGILYADKISLWQGDITRLEADAIVNAANSQMLGCFVPCHGCIDNAIHTYAGIQLREECYKIMKSQGYEEPTGRAKLTGGYNLPAKYIIHTVGPIVQSKLTTALETDLKNCYISCLQTALENDLRSIAFCCISTGEFHFPNDRAAKIAVQTVISFLDKYSDKFDRIIFNVFKDIDLHIYEDLFS